MLEDWIALALARDFPIPAIDGIAIATSKLSDARLRPISRRSIISAFRQLGFEGPYAGSKHQLVIGRGVQIGLPNPHGDVIGVDLLGRLLRQAGVSRKEWEAL